MNVKHETSSCLSTQTFNFVTITETLSSRTRLLFLAILCKVCPSDN